MSELIPEADNPADKLFELYLDVVAMGHLAIDEALEYYADDLEQLSAD